MLVIKAKFFTTFYQRFYMAESEFIAAAMPTVIDPENPERDSRMKRIRAMIGHEESDRAFLLKCFDDRIKLERAAMRSVRQIKGRMVNGSYHIKLEDVVRLLHDHFKLSEILSSRFGFDVDEMDAAEVGLAQKAEFEQGPGVVNSSR